MTRGRGSGGVAGPLRRLARDRGRLVAVVLLAATAVAASGIQSGAALALQQTLDANWRGAYDILVTSRALGAGSGSLLAPNSLGDGVHGMTLVQLAAVRKVSGVDVAAPIGEVLTSGQTSPVPSITLPVASAIGKAAQTAPQAFQYTATVTTDDGLGSRVVTTASAQNIVDLRPNRPDRPAESTPDADVEYNDVKVDCTTYPALCRSPSTPAYQITITDGNGGFGLDVANGGVLDTGFVSGLLTTSTRITLIDPAAERKLLGGRGDFLASLQKLPTGSVADAARMTDWAETEGGAFGRCFLVENRDAPDDDDSDLPADYVAQLTAFLAAHPKAAQVYAAQYVPVIVSGAPAASLHVRVDIEALGAAQTTATTDGSGTPPYVIPVSTARATRVGTIDKDVSAELNPFLGSTPRIPFPGTAQQPLADRTCTAAHSLNVVNAGVTSASGPVRTAGDRVSLAPVGYVNPAVQPEYGSDPFVTTARGTAVGAESVVQSATALKIPENAEGATAVPVGRFSDSALAAYEKSLDYVPLGAYQSVGADVRSGGRTTELRPTVSGRGLVSPRTVALASIFDASAWRQTAPVSAIRVRVAGIHGYSAAAVRKVVGVAQAIDALGLHSTIVAGSSPAPVSVRVEGYAFGTTDAQGAQRVGTLGDVRQYWSELGAAARTQVAVSRSTLVVLGIGLGAVVILLGAVQFSSVPRRRAQAAVLREIGWTRGTVRRWMIADEVPALVVVALVAAGSAWSAGFSAPAVVVGAVGLGAIVVTSAIAVLVGAARPRPRRPLRASSRRATARTPRLFGFRQARIHPGVSAVLVVATVIVAMSAGAVVLGVSTGSASAGQSLLARFSSAQALVPQLALGLAGLVAGVALAVIARRADLRARIAQWEALRAMGWTGRDVAAAQRAESLTIVVPAVVVSAALAVALAILVPTPALIVVIVAAVAAAIVISTSVLFLGRTARP